MTCLHFTKLRFLFWGRTDKCVTVKLNRFDGNDMGNVFTRRTSCEDEVVESEMYS